MEPSLGLGDFVLDGDPLPLPKRGVEAVEHHKISAHVYCGQTAGWMKKLVLGMEVGLCPR